MTNLKIICISILIALLIIGFVVERIILGLYSLKIELFKKMQVPMNVEIPEEQRQEILKILEPTIKKFEEKNNIKKEDKDNEF